MSLFLTSIVNFIIVKNFEYIAVIDKKVNKKHLEWVLRLKTKAQFLSELCFLMPHNLNYHLKMGNKRPPSISVSHDFR